jgi:starch-binding outer membrane protein, SusD/RagB family
MKRSKLIGIACAGVLAFAACSPSDILEVENPDIIDPASLETPQGLTALYAAGLGDFSFAVVGDNGGTEGQILVSGSFTDELGNSETFPTRKEYDIRGPIDLRNGTLTAVFRNIHRARRMTGKAATVLKEKVANALADARIGESYALEGMTYVFLGENYCSGVPVSEASDDGSGTLVFGTPLTTTELFDEAVKRFDSALVYAGTPASATVQNFARVGKARALLNLGQFAAAATAVTGVPTSFRYNLTHTLSLGRQQNGMFVFINQNERFSVANLDGTNGLNFRAANDPRVPFLRTPANDVGFDAATPQFDQGKYASETAPTAIANGVEARLIEAEAALQAGNPGTWLTTLNALRADASLVPSVFPTGWPTPTFPALTPLADPGTAAAREDLMFRERAFWLYLTGHRLGDLRRMVRQYARTADVIFPGGGGKPYIIDGNNKGGNFGTEVNLPIPFDELNNPNSTGCINRNP